MDHFLPTLVQGGGMTISYHRDLRPSAEAVRALYAAALLRRPVEDGTRIQAMLDGANVLVTAWEGERLVGFLRGVTDGVHDGYVADLAVHPAFQKAGIGRGLLQLLEAWGDGIRWVLLASPLAGDFYGRAGWTHLGNAWARSPQDRYPLTYEAFRIRHADLAARA